MPSAMFVLVALLLSGCDDYGADFDNTTLYQGPCSSRRDYDDGSSMRFTYEYEGGFLARIMEDGRLSSGSTVRAETTWRRDADGELEEVIEALEFNADGYVARKVWTFEATRVVVTLLEMPWSVYDRAAFAFVPWPGSLALNPRAELGILEHRGMPHTWSMEGPLLVRTSADERAEYELDAMGRVVVVRHDLEHDGDVDVVVRYTFDGERLLRMDQEGAAGSASWLEWRYDKAGNLATTTTDSVMNSEYPEWFEEYDYRCW